MSFLLFVIRNLVWSVRSLAHCFFKHFQGYNKAYLLLSLLALPAFSKELSGEQKQIRIEKHFQEVLYHYFQGNFAASLTQISLLDKKYPEGLESLPFSARLQFPEPKLVEGGSNLAYGLEGQAAEIFGRFFSYSNDIEKRTQAWFLLGLSYYHTGHWLKAADALRRFSAKEAKDYLGVQGYEQWIYTQVQLNVEHAKVNVNTPPFSMINWQGELASDSIYLLYLKYNQALDRLYRGDRASAISQLQEIVNSPPRSVNQLTADRFYPFVVKSNPNLKQQTEVQQQEVLALIDRANLTLGYALLQQEQPHQAARIFTQVRRYGLDGDAAVLGYGWAVSKTDELQRSLGIWQSLMTQNSVTEYGLEAYLASAYIYEKAYAPRQSVATLQAGVARFESVINDLATAKVDATQSSYLLALAQEFQITRPNVIEPVQVRKHNAALAYILNNIGTQSEFRDDLNGLHQTLDIEKQLKNSQQRMAQYMLMLDERETQRQAITQHPPQKPIFAKLDNLMSEREGLAKTIALILHEAKEQTLKSEAKEQPEIPDYLGYLAEIDQIISKANQTRNYLLKELNRQPDFDLQRQRINELRKRITLQSNSNQRLQEQLISKLSRKISDEITQHTARVNDYILQAHLAKVRLNDQAMQQNHTSDVDASLPDSSGAAQSIPSINEVQPK